MLATPLNGFDRVVHLNEVKIMKYNLHAIFYDFSCWVNANPVTNTGGGDKLSTVAQQMLPYQ